MNKEAFHSVHNERVYGEMNTIRVINLGRISNVLKISNYSC